MLVLVAAHSARSNTTVAISLLHRDRRPVVLAHGTWGWGRVQLGHVDTFFQSELRLPRPLIASSQALVRERARCGRVVILDFSPEGLACCGPRRRPQRRRGSNPRAHLF